MLVMAGAARLDQESVQAILNLIAAAVPGLRTTNIALIDSRGNLLARAGQPSSQVAAAQTSEELRHAAELRLARGVEEMLESTLGPGRVRAEVSLDMAFDQVRQTEEKYDPDGQVMRSQQTVSDNSRNTEQTNTVSVQNNLPNADAGANPSGSQSARQEETTNYEIGKTVRTLVSDQPQIRRLSIAVMVDGVVTHQPDGGTAWQERPAEDLARIGALVKSAVGYDEKRGDHVEVVGMRFTDLDTAAAPERGGLLGLEKPDIIRLAESGLLGVVAILALLLVGRPMALRLAEPRGADAVAAALENGGGAAGAALLEGPQQAASPGGGGAPGDHGLLGPGGTAALAGPDGLVNVGSIDGQMRASMLRQVAQLAAGCRTARRPDAGG
jgi:flagellar M-ring protein FliF